jgi:hypothetical protein
VSFSVRAEETIIKVFRAVNFTFRKRKSFKSRDFRKRFVLKPDFCDFPLMRANRPVLALTGFYVLSFGSIERFLRLESKL